MLNYIRNPCISKFYSPQLTLCHSGFYDCPLAKGLGQSNAIVPQSQFCALKPYFTGSVYMVSTVLGQLLVKSLYFLGAMLEVALGSNFEELVLLMDILRHADPIITIVHWYSCDYVPFFFSFMHLWIYHLQQVRLV
jgi:hypothetical protein